jgi:hypothetical protein
LAGTGKEWKFGLLIGGENRAEVMKREIMNYLKWLAGGYPAFFRFSLLKNHNLLPIRLQQSEDSLKPYAA